MYEPHPVAPPTPDDIVIVTDETQINTAARRGVVVIHGSDRERLTQPDTVNRVLAFAKQGGLENPGVSNRPGAYPYNDPQTGKIAGFRVAYDVMGR